MFRIAFLGLGGVGGYLSAKMARKFADAEGVEVVFLAREKTAQVIRANGIRLITPEEEFVVHPRTVYTPADQQSPVDILICAVKSYDLEQSLESFRGCINEDTAILPLLNGVDAEEKICAMFPANDVWSGCIYIVSRITAPGVITETGNIHRLHYGSDHDRHENLVFFFELTEGVLDRHLHSPAEIRKVIWEKFIFISSIASLTSYLDICIGKILTHEPNRQMLVGLLGEITTVAKAENILLDAEIISTTLKKFESLPYETTSSMHSDFRSGSRTELNSLTGKVVELAARHGIPVPTYSRILEGLRLRGN